MGWISRIEHVCNHTVCLSVGHGTAQSCSDATNSTTKERWHASDGNLQKAVSAFRDEGMANDGHNTTFVATGSLDELSLFPAQFPRQHTAGHCCTCDRGTSTSFSVGVEVINFQNGGKKY